MKPSDWIWRKYNDILEHEQGKTDHVPLADDVKIRAAFGAILLLLDAVLGSVEVAEPEAKDPP